MDQTLTQALSTFISGFAYKDLEPEIVEKVKTCILHNIAVGFAGFKLKSVQNSIKLAREFILSKPLGATILIDGSKVPPRNAAFANSVMIHARGQDDHYHPGIVHPGATVIPAALATGEIKNCDGKDFICSVAIGYEIISRLSKIGAKSSIQKGFRSTPLYGVFGAAAATARLLKMNAEMVSNSLGWAANLAGGLTEGITAHTDEIAYHAGIATNNGMLAASIANMGANTAPKTLEGKNGFYKAFSGHKIDSNRITKGLGKTYEMLNTFFQTFSGWRIGAEARRGNAIIKK